MENAPPPTTFTVPSRWDIWTSTGSSGFFWLFPLSSSWGDPRECGPQDGCSSSQVVLRGPRRAAGSSRGLVPEEREVVLPDVLQQHPASPCQGPENPLQALSPALTVPEHGVHPQGLEQHAL